MGGAVEGAGKVIVLTTVNPNAANSGGKFTKKTKADVFQGALQPLCKVMIMNERSNGVKANHSSAIILSKKGFDDILVTISRWKTVRGR